MIIGTEFLSKVLDYGSVLLPSEEDQQYLEKFQSSGFKNFQEYQTIDSIDSSVPEKSVLMIRLCSKNSNLSIKQWSNLADICRQKNLFPFFDCSSQGLLTGNPDTDAWPVRYVKVLQLSLFLYVNFEDIL